MTTTTTTSGVERGASSNRQWWLLICVLLVYSDSDLLAPNLTACAESLGLNDSIEKDSELGGGLSLGLFLVGAPAAFVVGILADGFIDRTKILSVVLMIGGLGCLLSSLAQNYIQLFLARSFTGVSLAGAMPLTYALVADWFSQPHERTKVFGRLDMMASIGIMLGQSVAGWIGPFLGWRVPFVVVGVPMLLASLAVSTVLVPNRPRARTRRRSLASFCRCSCKQWSSLFRRPTYWLLLLQGIPGCVPWSVLGTFWPDYLHVNVGYTVPQATWIVVAFKLGVLIGIYLTGSWLGPWLYRQKSSVRYPSLVMLVVGWMRIPFAVRLMNVLHLPCLMALLSGVLAAPTGTLVRAMVSMITEPQQRGMAYASFVLTDDIGRGAGPVWVAHRVAVLQQRKPALVESIRYGWGWNAFLAGLTYFTIVRDQQHTLLQATRNNHDDPSHV